MNQTPEELISRLALTPHPENGAFAERHYPHSGLERAASGAIYYYVAPDEKTEFHRIDCDEYWCYAAGETLDVWVIDPNGCLTVTRLGITPDAEPILYVKKRRHLCFSPSRSRHRRHVSLLHHRPSLHLRRVRDVHRSRGPRKVPRLRPLLRRLISHI